MPYCTVDKIKCLAEYAENITDFKKCIDCEVSCDNTVFEIEKVTKTYENVQID